MTFQAVICDITLAVISPTTHTSFHDGRKLLFYTTELTPAVELIFPSEDSASDALNFSLNPPRRGFMQLRSFLHSVSAFQNLSSFFPPELNHPHPVFTANLRACAASNSLELMMYLFVLPATEGVVTPEVIELCLELIGDSFLPFMRASVQMRWEMSSYGGQLVFRQNSQFTVLCRSVLRIFGGEFADLITKEARRLLDENGPKIQNGKISDDVDALLFIDLIFDPFVNFVLESIQKLPTICRVLNRLLLVRTAGFYVEQNAAFLVLPNLLFLRFLVPPLAEETARAYVEDPKMKRIATLLSGALLSLCNELGWPEDKEPYLMKFNDRIERFYGKLEDWTFKLIDCHEWDYDWKKLNPKGDLVELLKGTASRVILMDQKDANMMIHCHVDFVSIMHMIEEYVYDFSGVGQLKSQ
jgi:hypothetical protein